MNGFVGSSGGTHKGPIDLDAFDLFGSREVPIELGPDPNGRQEEQTPTTEDESVLASPSKESCRGKRRRLSSKSIKGLLSVLKGNNKLLIEAIQAGESGRDKCHSEFMT